MVYHTTLANTAGETVTSQCTENVVNAHELFGRTYKNLVLEKR